MVHIHLFAGSCRLRRGWPEPDLACKAVPIPFLARLIPSDLKIPSFLLYVYRGDNFYFVTSPLLILISLVYLLLFLLRAFGSH